MRNAAPSATPLSSRVLKPIRHRRSNGATITLSTEEWKALIAEREALRAQLQVVKVERDLLQERLKAFMRKLFAAKSEARAAEQRDMFLNEAEALAPTPATAPAREESDAGAPIKVGAHRRKKRGRKPLDAALPREIVRHDCPNRSASVRMTVRRWWKSVPRSANRSTSFLSRCA